MAVGKEIRTPSPTSKRNGRTKMASANRKMAYLASEHGRENSALLDHESQPIHHADATERIGGKDADYVEAVSSSSRLECEALYARETERAVREGEAERSHQEVMAEFFGDQFRQLDVTGTGSYALHGQSDGSYHAHYMLKGERDQYPHLEGPKGALQKAWDETWRKGEDRAIQVQWSVRERLDPIQEELRQAKDQRKELTREQKQAQQDLSAEVRVRLREEHARRAADIEMRMHVLEIHRIEIVYASRNQTGKLEHQVALEREQDRHTGAARKVQMDLLNIQRWQARQLDAQDADRFLKDLHSEFRPSDMNQQREAFKYLEIDQRKQVREAALERELEVLKTKHEQDKTPSEETLARNAEENRAVLLKFEAGLLRDQEGEWSKRQKDTATQLSEGKDPVRDLVLQRHTIEQEALKAEAAARGLGEPDERSQGRLERRQADELVRLDERQAIRNLPAEQRDRHRSETLELRRELLKVQYEREREAHPEIAKKLVESEAKALAVLGVEHRVQLLRDRESDHRLSEKSARDRHVEALSLMQERHGLEVKALELKAQAFGREQPDTEDKVALQKRHAAETEKLSLIAPIEIAREREQELGGHQRELSCLLIEGTDLRTEAMAERHQAERDLLLHGARNATKIEEPARPDALPEQRPDVAEAPPKDADDRRKKEPELDPETAERLRALDVRQAREREDLADRRLLQNASGMDRAAIRERLQGRAQEALKDRQVADLSGVQDPEIRQAMEARHHAEAEALNAKQRGERLRDRDLAVRESLDERLEGLEVLADRLAARAEAMTARQALQVERHQAEREALDARERAGQGITAEDRKDLAQRQDREVRGLALDAQIEVLREKEFDSVGDRPGRLEGLFQKLTSQSRYDEAEKLAEQRRALERQKVHEAVPPEDRGKAIVEMDSRHREEREDLATRKALDVAKTPGAKQQIREAQLARKLEGLRIRLAEDLAGVEDPRLVAAIRQREALQEDALRLNHQASLMRDQEQDQRSHMAPILVLRLAQYKDMGEAMNKRHAVEIQALEARGKTQGLPGADPKDLKVLTERHAQEKAALKETRDRDIAGTLTRPAKSAARKAVALPAKAVKKLTKASERVHPGREHGLKHEADMAEGHAHALGTAAGTAVLKTATTALTKTAEAAVHQVKHIIAGAGVTATAIATGIANPAAGAKAASEGYAKVGKDAAADATKDFAGGAKATGKDASTGAKDTAQQGLASIGSLGMDAMPAELKAAIGVIKESTKASLKTAASIIQFDAMGTLQNAGQGALAVAGEASMGLKGDLGLAAKPLDWASKIPVIGLAPAAVKLAAEMALGGAKIAGMGRGVELDI